MFYNGETDENTHNNMVQKKSFRCICLLVILIDFVFKLDKNYYQHMC